MRITKRLLSVILAFTLIVGIVYVPALAAQSTKYDDEAWVLYQLGLFRGVSTTEYRPNLEANLLREEAVALLLRMFNLEEDALKMSDTEAKQILNKKFKDTDQIASWAIKYIAYAVEKGIIAGRPDGNFAPKDYLLGREYAKMILAMLGYIQGIDFEYQFATVEFCNVTGFSKSEAARLDNETILRDHVVGMSFYALKAEYASGANKGKTVIEVIVGNDEYKKQIAINAGLMEEPVIVSVERIPDIEIKVGQILNLPSTVKVTYSDGKTGYVPVKWPYIDTSKAMPKTQITGTIEGTSIVAKVNVTIDEIILKVRKVEANNLIEVVVEFNKDVSDNEEVKKKDNYSLDVAKIKSVETKGNVAVLTLEKAPDNQKKAKLTINDKILQAKETFEFTFFDAELPEVLDVETTGPRELTVTFSEPIEDVNNAKVTIKQGNSTLSVNMGGIEINKNKVKIPLYSSLVDGKEYVITLQGFKDYAGYNNIIKTVTINYVKDNTPPIAEIESARQEYVVVKFNKPVSGLHKEQFSHTFSAWTASKITSDEDGTLIDSKKSYDTVYVWFYTGDKKNDKPIPEGYNTLRILGKVVASDDGKTYEIVDLWGNKFETETYTIYVTADRTKPEVKKITVTAEDVIEIEFSKRVSFDKDNLEILDGNGKTISGLTYKVEPDNDAAKFTVTFNKRLAGNTIIVNIKNVYDASLNSNKLDLYSERIDITDKTPPEITKVTYGVEKQGSKEVGWFLYVFYNENVEPDTALNPSNYYLKNGGTYTRLSENAEFYAGDKIVKITLTSKQKDLVNVNSTQLFVTNVKDIAGNEILPGIKNISDMNDSSNAPYIKEAIAVEPDKIEITFSEELGTYDLDAFVVDLAGSSKDIKVVGLNEELDSNGRTKLTLIIDGKLPYNTSGDKVKIIEPRAISNLFGVQPVVLEKEIKDNIKPEVIKGKPIVADASGKIIIRFTEALNNTINSLVSTDVVIEEESSRDKLVAGIDYTVSVDNTHERLWIDGEYIDVYGKIIVDIKYVSPNETYKVYSKDTITYITDDKGNTAKPFTDAVKIKGSDLISGAIDSLKAVKAEAEAKKQADYTPESWAEFISARTAAFALPEGNAAEITNKINAINAAISKLVFAGQAALDAAKLEASGKVEADYTADSWSAFVAARATALAMPETTNQEVVAKTNAINEAIAKLVTHKQAFEQALANAQDGSTVALTGNITGDININKLISLDLKGYTITGNVSISSNTAGTITIANGTINGNLTVDAPNATVNNGATVTGMITIKDVSSSSWNENANGNSIIVQDNTGITINIAAGKTVKSLTINSDGTSSATITLTLGDGAVITEPVVINQPIILICSQPVQAKIANGVKVIVKESADGEPKEIVGTGDNESVTIMPYRSVEVETKEALINALNNNNIDIILLKNDITLTSPLFIERKVTIEGVNNNGGRRALTINSGVDKTGNNSPEGLVIFGVNASGTIIRNITVKGNHGDNLIEIYDNTDDAKGNMVVTLENVEASDGKKAGIYVNKDNAGTITVNFKSITTSGNKWNAGIGLAAQKSGSKIVAKFSGTHSFGEPVALYHEGTTYPGKYEVNDPDNSLNGYAEVSIDHKVGEQTYKQQKWVKVSLTKTEDGGIKLESKVDIEGLKTYITLSKTVTNSSGKEEEVPVRLKDIFESFVLKTDNDEKSYDIIQLISDNATSFIYGPDEGFRLEASKPQVTRVISYTIAEGAPEGSYKLTTQVKQGDKIVAEITTLFTIHVSKQ